MNIHGWVNLDKPIGMSSSRAVYHVKKILGVKKVGHAGTLDPLASGVLPIAIGEATKVTSYVMENFKTYLFGIQWGEQRSTDDLEGHIILKSDVRCSTEEIKKVIISFIGEINQCPPVFSAVHVNGSRAYELGRNNQDISLASRTIYVKSLNLVSRNYEENNARFFIICGKGTYIRAIARDLGKVLKCFGYVNYLRRDKVGVFLADQSITLEQLEKKKRENNVREVVYSLNYVLQKMFSINIAAQEAKRIQNGQNIMLNNLYIDRNYDICYARMGEIPIAICSIHNNIVKPIRVFNI